MCQSMLILFNRLKAFLASMRRNPHSSSISDSSQMQFAAWIQPLFPALRPVQSCIEPYAVVASSPQHFNTTSTKRQRQITPMPIWRTPGDLSTAISLSVMNAQYATKGTKKLESQATSFATKFCSSVLALPNPSSHLLWDNECTPPRPDAPKRRLVTPATVSSETSSFQKAGIFLHSLSGCLWWVVELGVFFP